MSDEHDQELPDDAISGISDDSSMDLDLDDVVVPDVVERQLMNDIFMGREENDGVPAAVQPGLMHLPLLGGIRGSIGPHRVQSNDRITRAMSGFVFGDRLRFKQNYRVLSTRHLESKGHANLESGGKLILPPDALEKLSRNSSALMRPMMFKATNLANRKITHCGVLEFIAEEGTCYMPSWMMDLLGLRDLDMIQLERADNLPTATFVKFQAQSVDFLEITDQRAVLENTLRHFSCLTKNDVIAIHYNSRMYKLCVLELLPADVVTIIECDMNVDFAAPVGYVSPSASDTDNLEDDIGGGTTDLGKNAFVGSGYRLNGKAVDVSSGSKAAARGTVPDLDWKIGGLDFKRKFGHKSGKSLNPQPKFTAFGGMGLTLRGSKKSKSGNDEEDAL